MQENNDTNIHVYDSNIYAESREFCGTATWYRHSLVKRMLFTDGVHWIRDKLSAYWLIDDIAIFSSQFFGKEQFMVAEFTCSDNCDGTLSITDGNDRCLKSYSYAFADLVVTTEQPLRFYLAYGGDEGHYVLMLLSEY